MAGEVKQTLTIEPQRKASAVSNQPHLFVVIEGARPVAGGARCALTGVSSVAIGRGDSRLLERARIEVPDSWMSSKHATIKRTPSGWIIEDAGSKNGVMVNGTRVDRRYLADGDVIELGRSFFILRTEMPTASSQPAVVDSKDLDGATGFSSLLPPLAMLFTEAAIMASTPASLVILGPTGSGKELAARALHRASSRTGPLVAVNCGALADSVLESELFGHKAGAFSGADKDHVGLIAASSGGTLFLDEVGELGGKAQAALLRVLQEREVRPVGSTKTIDVDLRVVCATHRPLAELAGAEFREDLLARLSGFELVLPPLAERREDLGHILAALLERNSDHTDSVELSAEAARAYIAYDWPRNVRELEASIVRALAMSDGAMIEDSHLEPHIAAANLAPTSAAGASEELSAQDSERRAKLIELLGAHAGNVSAVARDMGALRQTVQKWLKRYGLDARDYRA